MNAVFTGVRRNSVTNIGTVHRAAAAICLPYFASYRKNGRPNPKTRFLMTSINALMEPTS